MDFFCFRNDDDKRYALACLTFAKKLGQIEDDSLDAVKTRCAAENEKRAKMLKKDEVVYGLSRFSPSTYLQYELTRFKVEFTEETIKNYQYKEITKKDEKAFYKNNKELFSRYGGDHFFFREVRMVAHKKLREEEYENEIKNILCQFS